MKHSVLIESFNLNAFHFFLFFLFYMFFAEKRGGRFGWLPQRNGPVFTFALHYLSNAVIYRGFNKFYRKRLVLWSKRL